jgi:hypothetical protein
MAVARAAASIRLVSYAVFACAGLLGCARSVQAWPPPLSSETSVSIRFARPRIIVFDPADNRDTVTMMGELRGRVVSLHGDTLMLRVTGSSQEQEAVGRVARVLLDSATVVTRSEVDGWKVGYGILATGVLIFAVLVLSGS